MNLKNTYALIIGVGGNDIPETVNDAKAIAEILTDPQKAAYLKENVTLLTESKATRMNVLNALKALASKVKTDNDATVVVYFSGHGGLFGETYYILTHGYNMYDKPNTMINGDEFSQLINQIEAERLLVMLDCCHAAGVIEPPISIKTKGDDEDEVSLFSSNISLIEKLNSGEGKVFLTSCDDNEKSLILPNAKYSLFTQIAIEALEGHASLGSEYVRMIEFLCHLLINVPKRAAVYHRTQRPMINHVSSLSPDYFLCKSSFSTFDIPEIPPILKEKSMKHRFEALLQKHSIKNIVTPTSEPHYLHQFPKGPMVEGYMINDKIIETYAKSINQQQSRSYINQANRLRKQADPQNSQTTLINHIELPSPRESNAANYWAHAFHQASLNGPRMLAALLNVLTDDKYDTETLESKNQLLEYLKNHK
ncbi:caspase family protein [Kordia sp.]|uniref:caspase family protein n=1 Tax=Kordia sp. TaxID=1965332 RepID=UPI003D6A8381